MSVTRINEFLAADGKAAELFAFLRSLKSYISASDGCLSCDVLQKNDNESHFVVLEKWDLESSHAKSVADYPKENFAAAMALIGAPPKGGFYHD